MELAQELMVTGVVAVLVSFLIAKLVSMVMAAGDSSRDSKLTTTSDRDFDRDTSHEVVMEELRFRERLEIRGFPGEQRTEPVEEAAAPTVDVFVGGAGRVDDSGKSANRGGVGEIECSQFPDDSVEKGLKEEEEQKKSLGEMLAKKEEECDTEEKVDSKEGREVNLEQLQPICVDLAGESSGVVEQSEEISIVESELKEDVDEKKIEIESEEDDWEGIERSELEKLFAEAAKFVGSGDVDGRLASLGSDALIKLYGLHKLATEGPCREQPPLALKVAARAKCDGGHWLRCARNAWQRLGNMSPELAMEQYIALVSDRVPRWMEDKSTGDGNLGSSISMSPGAAATDISTLSFNQQDIKNERNQEQRTGAENSDLTEGSTSKNQVKE